MWFGVCSGTNYVAPQLVLPQLVFPLLLTEPRHFPGKPADRCTGKRGAVNGVGCVILIIMNAMNIKLKCLL